MSNITKARGKVKIKNCPSVLANMNFIGKLARTISSVFEEEKLMAVGWRIKQA